MTKKNEMTLEQVRDGLHGVLLNHTRPSWTELYAWEQAIDAHLRGGVVTEPLSVFSPGMWKYEPIGQWFTKSEMDEAAFQAYRDAIASVAPAGFVVVPVEPTKDECRAVGRALKEKLGMGMIQFSAVHMVVREAMLAASQAHASQGDTKNEH